MQNNGLEFPPLPYIIYIWFKSLKKRRKIHLTGLDWIFKMPLFFLSISMIIIYAAMYRFQYFTWHNWNVVESGIKHHKTKKYQYSQYY